MIIKCKGWDTVRRKMYSAEELGADQEALLPDGRGFANISGTSTRLTQIHSYILPLLYLGIYDCDGAEICEGDLVQWHNDSGLVGKPKEVKATPGGWNPFIDDMQTDGSWRYKIIGNIYEK
jgi:hypothetical protein